MIILFIGWAELAQAQNTSLSGKVVDESGEPLAGVNIVVKDEIVGTITDIKGEFALSLKKSPPFTLVFSMVGFATQEMEISQAEVSGLDITLKEQAIMGQEVVVSASRVEESILESPVTIEKMDILAINNTPAANFYDGIADLKGVQMTTSSMTFKSVNTRGFATLANTRFVQLIDGMDNAAPGLNFPMGNIVGISDLDVESVELVPGAASALYGPNAFNGILLMTSKNPFEYQGLSVTAKGGVTDQNAAGTNGFGDFSLRYAKAFNNKFAFKVNFSYLTATDWYATDYSQLTGEDPGPDNTNYNGVNVYGDFIATTLDWDQLAGLPTGTLGRSKVARTGYEEVDLIDYNTYSFKSSASLNYRLNDHMELSYDYRYGLATSIYQGFSRYSLKNLTLQQHKIELRGDNFFLRAYTTIENAGDAYDSRFAAWNINRSWRPDITWFNDYANAYLGFVPGITGFDHRMARSWADNRDSQGNIIDPNRNARLLPGTPEFEAEKKKITELADLATGSKFIDKSKMYHVEGSYNLKNEINFMDVIVGGNFRQYRLQSSGTIFNDGGGPISINEYGGYVQVGKKVMNDRISLLGSIRYDKNENFDGQFSPRASVVFSLDSEKKHNLRGSFQTGFRNPDTQSQFIALDLGPAVLVGGTQKNLDMYNRAITTDAQGNPVNWNISGSTLYNNSYTLSSANDFSASNGTTPLVTANVGLVKPEQITSFEFGYKGVIANKLMLDINYYHNKYTDFQLNETVVVIPDGAGSVNDLTGVGALAAGNFFGYQLYTNVGEDVTSNGVGLGAEYAFPRGYRFGGSYNYADFSLNAKANPDLIPGFNTPQNRFNLHLGNRKAIGNFGFQVALRYSEKYFWSATFGQGDVPSFTTVDAQVSYALKSLRSIVKIGANNIGGNEFIQAYGAPQIGQTYYISLTFNQFMK